MKLLKLALCFCCLAAGVGFFGGKKKPRQHLKIAVMDFTTTDIEGQKRFLKSKSQDVKIGKIDSLNDKDRRSISSFMQGFPKMIEAYDAMQTNNLKRTMKLAEWQREWQKQLALHQKVVEGKSRPIVLGGDYLQSYLAKHNDVFRCIDKSQIQAALAKVEKEKDFPKDFMKKISKLTGATHIIYGTVSDLRRKENSFSGYGIKTKTVDYSLDVLLKVADLEKQQIVYSGVYTANYREQQAGAGKKIDHDKFQNLMNEALKEATADLYQKAKADSGNALSVNAKE